MLPLFSFCFVFRLNAFVEAVALRSILLRYTGAPIVTRVSSFFPFVYLEILFSEYFLYHSSFPSVWRVRRTFFPSELCFSTSLPRAVMCCMVIFDISLCENSINQSIILRRYILSTCYKTTSYHYNRGYGKERRILIGSW